LGNYNATQKLYLDAKYSFENKIIGVDMISKLYPLRTFTQLDTPAKSVIAEKLVQLN